ncbi:MAG: 50S ribosomal protein L21 [Spirochaetales bacterium]|nr:50S ribosomal protein L21 [Spirochaetales bacterium]
MYALVEIKGKQYKVEKGSLIKVDLLGEEAGSTVEFDKVLMLSGEDSPKIGTPYVDGAKIKATVGESVKGTKVNVLKFKRRKGYHRTQGHRQQYTLIKVNEITG